MNMSSPPDDLRREVYGVLGIPVDAIDTATALSRIKTAAANAAPFLVSTANLNFLTTSQFDAEFRESLMLTDLCTADGMPIVWLARLLGVPLKERIAGSDLFVALKSANGAARRLKIFFFGGADGAAATACAKLNAESGGVLCVGSHEPGFGPIEDMSSAAIIETINASGADFLAIALGAKKGQVWLLRNHDRLRVPVRAHLGATVNFQAGTVARAPLFMRRWGMEWLWRIKEEPKLWSRYSADGLALLRLVLTRVFPLLILARWNLLRRGRSVGSLSAKRVEDHKSVILSINGDATGRNIGNVVPAFEQAAAAGKPVVINFTDTGYIDARFLGLLLMLNKQLKKQHLQLSFTGVSPRIARLIRLNGFEFLLHS